MPTLNEVVRQALDRVADGSVVDAESLRLLHADANGEDSSMVAIHADEITEAMIDAAATAYMASTGRTVIRLPDPPNGSSPRYRVDRVCAFDPIVRHSYVVEVRRERTVIESVNYDIEAADYGEARREAEARARRENPWEDGRDVAQQIRSFAQVVSRVVGSPS